MKNRSMQILVAFIILMITINIVQANNETSENLNVSEETLKDQLEEINIAYKGLLDLKDDLDKEGYLTGHIQDDLEIIESLFINVSEQLDKGEYVSAKTGMANLKSRIVSASSSLFKSKRKGEVWCTVLLIILIGLITLCIFLKRKNFHKK